MEQEFVEPEPRDMTGKLCLVESCDGTLQRVLVGYDTVVKCDACSSVLPRFLTKRGVLEYSVNLNREDTCL